MSCFSKCRFLYSDEVQIGPETVMTTLYTAKKYAVPALEAHCVEFLKKNLRADNAFMLLTQVITTHLISALKTQPRFPGFPSCLTARFKILASVASSISSLCVCCRKHDSSCFQARLFDEPQLASLCLENIDKNTADALAAEGFTDIDLGTALSYMLTYQVSTTNLKVRCLLQCLMLCLVQTRLWQCWKETRWGYGKSVSSGPRYVGRMPRLRDSSYSPPRKTSAGCWEKHFLLFASLS